MSDGSLDEEGVPTAAGTVEVAHGHQITEPTVDPEPPGASASEAGAEPETSLENDAPTPKKQRAFAGLAVALGIVALAALVAAASLWTTLDGERSERDDILEVSGDFAAALLTYDYEDLERTKQRVLALSTGKFRREYEQAFDGGLDTLFKETRARSAGTVTDLFVGEIDDGSVTTLAVVNASSVGAGGRRRLSDTYLELQLVKVGGKWRVDGATYLNLSGSDAPAPGVSTTTTTAPPK